ncbi:MAG: anaerobic ribonucleoside-triphosphate reductase activating protein [Butyrivibrio sp.]|nr:anaerobic ribonucleoside-triphosphate reductase activating protein [Butyrivibrio sp.]
MESEFKLHGLQKLTLLDYPEHVAATIFLGGCDFCCPFCHNYELVDGSASPIMGEEDLFSFLNKRQGVLDAVAITGGEPCLNKHLDRVIDRIRDLGYKIKLDTNGNHPDVLERLLSSGKLDYVAMDIKNSPEKYAKTIGVTGFDLSGVKKSVEVLKNCNIDYEFRTTVINELHEKSDFLAIGEWIEGAKAYYLQQFVQRDTVPDSTFTSPTKEDMDVFLDTIFPFVQRAEIRGL